MNENKKKDGKFVGHEYKTITVRRDMESLWADSLKPFGWQLEKSGPAVVKHLWAPLRLMMAPLALLPGTPFAKLIRDHDSDTHSTLSFKRDKQILNKTELTRLELQFENQARTIDELETSKTAGASALAYTIGIIGTAFMAGATFSYLAGMLPACIVLAILGFIGWIVPYFAFQSAKNSKTMKVIPTIEHQYENIYAICRKANEITAMA